MCAAWQLCTAACLLRQLDRHDPGVLVCLVARLAVLITWGTLARGALELCAAELLEQHLHSHQSGRGKEQRAAAHAEVWYP
jgi:hypothetical protein